ncbi:ChbG/HpnK family deacetylase [Roseateles koreensis]|uniref:ChbG/HpnK family deacetylase n=1 Tax=Roseateles koreensis TaxID=2987526 RepID=A0ABT5KTJ9_9BURK|nr:ChbG/HpnK family deacetylase [Roseateles koreensis]
MKRIQICADDYGFDDAVSRGILDCIDAGRISATSCMVLSPVWADWAGALRERSGAADYGLHLDINEFADYAPGQGLSAWIRQGYFRQLDRSQLRSWIATQLDAFEAQMKRAPDYVDGHQHVHQLPQLREELLRAVTQRYGPRCAVRSTQTRVWRGSKAAVIAALGSAALRRGARKAGLRANRDFAGVYGFEATASFSELAAGWLASLPDGGLMMTHPGQNGATQTRHDPIRAARVREWQFWMGEEAGELLASLGVQLGMSEDWPLA